MTDDETIEALRSQVESLKNRPDVQHYKKLWQRSEKISRVTFFLFVVVCMGMYFYGLHEGNGQVCPEPEVVEEACVEEVNTLSGKFDDEECPHPDHPLTVKTLDMGEDNRSKVIVLCECPKGRMSNL